MYPIWLLDLALIPVGAVVALVLAAIVVPPVLAWISDE